MEDEMDRKYIMQSTGDGATLNVRKSSKNILRRRWEITLNGP